MNTLKIVGCILFLVPFVLFGFFLCVSIFKFITKVDEYCDERPGCFVLIAGAIIYPTIIVLSIIALFAPAMLGCVLAFKLFHL